MNQGQESGLNEYPSLNGEEGWSVGLLRNLIDVVARSLAETPPDMPDYVETHIQYKGHQAKIRVEFD